MSEQFSDQYWMEKALNYANEAAAINEIPVGAVLVKDNQLISYGYNRSIIDNDPSAHAEMMAIREAGKALNNYRLIDCTLYVTLEPCSMCAGLLVHSRIKRLVFGAYDSKRGAVCSALSLTDAHFLNHRVEWKGGVLERMCSELLIDFFRAKRK